MKTRFGTQNVIFAIAVIALNTSQVDAYTRDEAYNYLRNYILGSSVQYLESFGSQAILSPTTTVVCMDDTIYAPNYSSWLFSIDLNYSAGLSHPIDLYFINSNDLNQWTIEPVVWPVINIVMDFIQLDMPPGDLINADTNLMRIPYATPDPHLKALIICGSQGGHGVVDNFNIYLLDYYTYNSTCRFYIMLKMLGFGDVRVCMGTNYNNNLRLPDVRILVPYSSQPGDSSYFWIADHNLDLDPDSTNDVTSNATRADIRQAYADLAADIGPLDRVVIYSVGHSDNSGNNLRLVTWDGHNPGISTDTLYSWLLPLTGCAELFVILDHCWVSRMFTEKLDDYFENFSRTHILAACRPSQQTYAEAQFTHILYSIFTYYFTSYFIGTYPYLFDIHNGRAYGTNVWAYGSSIEYTIFTGNHCFPDSSGGACYDNWIQPDRNNDGVKSFREAVEYTWARMPGISEYNINKRFPRGALGIQEPHYIFQRTLGTFNPEYDSSGTVTFTGRGGYVNWASDDVDCNWTSLKKYIVTHTLKFTSLQNPPSTTIGNTGVTPVEFLFYPNTGITFARTVNPIVNADFKSFYGGTCDRWLGVAINNDTLTLQNSEIENALTGLAVYNQTSNNDVLIKDVEVNNCVVGFDFWNSNSAIVIDNCQIYECLFGAIFQNSITDMASCDFITNSDAVSIFDNSILFSYYSDIIHNDYGVVIDGLGNFADFSSPTLLEITNNQFVLNNFYGVYVSSNAAGSFTLLGNPGWNCFIDNGVGAIYNGLAGTFIDAEYNYWGSDPPDLNEFQGPGAVDYIPYWDGEEGVMPPRTKDNSEHNTNEFEAEIVAIFNHFKNENFDTIPGLCRDFVLRHPNSPNVLAALNLWIKASRRLDRVDGLTDELTNLLQRREFDRAPARQWQDIVLANCEISAGDYVQAQCRLERRLDNDVVSAAVRINTLITLANLNLFGLNDTLAAFNLFRRIINDYPDSRYADLAEVRLNTLRHWIDSRPPIRPDNSEVNLPMEYILLEAYPNPFNNQTVIRFQIPKAGDISLELFDLTGRLSQIIFSDRVEAGSHQIVWNSESLPDGLYLCRLETENAVKTVKLVLIK
ncbi:MAG: T9SS type A sorting domain-containing protein [Calditrichaeota bacterium]|nr:T9SS type A sorting domain-containing protein [Calditrichota bacterium]